MPEPKYMSSDMPDTAAKLPSIRNNGSVATWVLVRKVVASGRKRADGRRKSDEQRRAENAGQSHDGGERHLSEHQQPHDDESDRHRGSDILRGPTRQPRKLDEAERDRAEDRRRHDQHDRGHDRQGLRLLRDGGMPECPSDGVDRHHDLNQRSDPEQQRDRIHEGRLRPAEDDGGAPLLHQVAGKDADPPSQNAKEQQEQQRTERIEPCRHAAGQPAGEKIDPKVHSAGKPGRNAGRNRYRENQGGDFVERRNRRAGKPAHQHVDDGGTRHDQHSRERRRTQWGE